jgi:cytochrome c oxidase cbb3-type subunit III
MRITHRLLVLPVLLVLVIAGQAAAQSGDPDPQRGGRLYVENCAVCHGVDGQGRIGASLDAFPGIQPGAAMREAIRTGIPGTVMPGWAEELGGPLSLAEIDDIVAYLIGALSGTEALEPLPTYQPPVLPALPDIPGDPSQGAVVYQENCQACHGEHGEGRFGWPLAKAWPGTDPAAFIRTVVSQGIEGTAMPAWERANGGPLSVQQITDVAAYLLTLRPTSGIPPAGTPQEGPLNMTVSLVALAGLALLLLIVALVYYRQAG